MTTADRAGDGTTGPVSLYEGRDIEELREVVSGRLSPSGSGRSRASRSASSSTHSTRPPWPTCAASDSTAPTTTLAIHAGAATGTVTEVALRWGFTHLGRFSGEYRQTYGRTPAATMRGRR